MSRHHYSSNDLADGISGGLIGIALLLILLLIFLLIKLGKKVYEAFRANPKSPALLIPLCMIVITALLMAITKNPIQAIAAGLHILSLIAFFLGAIGVSMYYDPLMHNSTPTVAMVLRRKW